jgi:site-specific DNA-methyltransferase (adenine-specific)
MTPYHESDGVVLYHGDCREILPQLGQQFQTVMTDPPYGKVRGDFDQAWTNRMAMLADVTQWRDSIVDRMTANATLWWFAWPSLAGMIEANIAEKLNPLSHVVWKKPISLAQKHMPERLRAPGPETERILMFEQYGADSWALGETGYAHKCDEARGLVFEPLRAYLAGERDRAGFTTRQVAEAYQQKTGSRTVTGMAGHWFESVQWSLPTEENYHWLRGLFGSEFLRREYEDLRREYEDLRREYEDLRRYFDLKTGQPKTDIWEFPIATADERLGHPTPKPLALMRFMVDISVRPGTAVLDPFAGSGTTLLAAKLEGRKAVGIEISEEYCEIAANRLRQRLLF